MTTTQLVATLLLSFLNQSSGYGQDSPDAALEAALEAALRGGNAAVVGELFRRHPALETFRIDGRPPLVWAAHRGEGALVDGLIDAGFAVDAADENHHSALDYAAWFDKAEIVNQLIAAGADPNRPSSGLHGRRPIDFGAKGGSLEVIAALLEAGADPDGKGAIVKALSGDHWPAVRALLDAGADPNLGDSMLTAAERAPVELLAKMLDAGGDANRQAYYGGALARATHDLDKVRLLIDHGADVNGSRKNGDRPMHRAAFHGASDAARYLRARGAEIDVVKHNGQRPIDIALQRGHGEFVEWLLEEGAAPSLGTAVALDDINAIERWLTIDSSLRDQPLPADGPPPLHLAISFEAASAMTKLLEAGANPNTLHGDVSSLHLAVVRQNVNATRQLLAAGADPNPTYSRGRYVEALATPLALAVARGVHPGAERASFVAMIRALIEHGADPHRSTSAGRTPFTIARDARDDEFLERLATDHPDVPIPYYGRSEFKPTPADVPLVVVSKSGPVAIGNFDDLPIFAAGPTLGQTVADIGCSNGPHIDDLSRLVGPSGKVFARDISSKDIDKITARKLDNVDALTSKRGDVMVPEQSVDIALLAEMWHSVDHQETRDDFARSLYRAMKPGGVVVITLYGRNGWWSRPELIESAHEILGRAGFEPGQRFNVYDRSKSPHPNYVIEFRRPTP